MSLLGGNKKVSANSSSSTTIIASKNQILGTKNPSFLYGRGSVTIHTGKSYNGRLYAMPEYYVNGILFHFLIFESLINAKKWKKLVKLMNTHNFLAK